MPAYNVEKYVEEAIDSILAQTFPDFELIIVNDGSRDKTKQIIQRRALRDKRIVFIDSEQNRGVATSLNVGIQVARGKYIARMDADDIVLPERLATQHRFLEAHEKIDICGTAIRAFYPDGRAIDAFYDQQDAQIKTNMLFKSPFSATLAHASILFRRTLFEQFHYDQQNHYSEDAYLYLDMALNGQVTFSNLHQSYYLYRLHDTSISGRRSHAQAEEHIAFLARTLKNLQVLTSKELILYRKMMAVEKIPYSRESEEKVEIIFAKIKDFCCRRLTSGADALVEQQIQKISGQCRKIQNKLWRHELWGNV